MADGAIRVVGLKELSRDFKAMSKDIHQDVVWELEEAANPVRKEAQQLALTQIRNMSSTPHYAGMRIGVTKSNFTVYMVPSWKTTRARGRPNLAGLLMEKAMEPALDHNEGEVVKRVDDFLGELSKKYGF